MLKDLIKVANYLDSLGLKKEANNIDSIIKKIAGSEDLVISDLSYLGLIETELDAWDDGPPQMMLTPVLRFNFSVNGFSKTKEIECNTYASSATNFLKDLEAELCTAISLELSRNKVMDYRSSRALCEDKVKDFLNIEIAKEIFDMVSKDLESKKILTSYEIEWSS